MFLNGNKLIKYHFFLIFLTDRQNMGNIPSMSDPTTTTTRRFCDSAKIAAFNVVQAYVVTGNIRWAFGLAASTGLAYWTFSKKAYENDDSPSRSLS